jgi:hemerythrin superfamily protein
VPRLTSASDASRRGAKRSRWFAATAASNERFVPGTTVALGMAMSDPIALLIHDHRRMEGMLRELAEAGKEQRGPLLEAVADALAAHVALEEEHFYPAVRARRTEDILLESLEEHLSLKRVMSDLLDLTTSDERWEAKMHVLKEQAEHHHKEEEENLFPKVQKLFDGNPVAELGDAMRAALAALHAEHPRIRIFGRTREAARLSTPDVAPMPARR